MLKQAFGFEDYLRGYEYYVIDGSQFVMTKTAVKWTLLPTTEMQLPITPMNNLVKPIFLFTSVSLQIWVTYTTKRLLITL